jgi:hypothetical protein
MRVDGLALWGSQSWLQAGFQAAPPALAIDGARSSGTAAQKFAGHSACRGLQSASRQTAHRSRKSFCGFVSIGIRQQSPWNSSALEEAGWKAGLQARLPAPRKSHDNLPHVTRHG